MKNRKIIGVWLLLFILVLTQITFPSAKAQGNEDVVNVESMEKGEEPEQLEEDPDGEEKDTFEYEVKIQPVDKDNHAVSAAKIMLQTSTDQNSWVTVDSVSSGWFQLPVKAEETDCYYKFSITATDYYTFYSETFSFTQESNPYFDLKTVEDGKITIQPVMEKKPDQYRVEIKAVDEQGNPLPDARVEMKWRKDIYGWKEQNAVSPGVYDL